MTYVKCYPMYPDCFRIAHDVSVESFSSFADDGDEGIDCDHDLNSSGASSISESCFGDCTTEIERSQGNTRNQENIANDIASGDKRNANVVGFNADDDITRNNVSDISPNENSPVQYLSEIKLRDNRVNGSTTLRIEDVDRLSCKVRSLNLKEVELENDGIDKENQKDSCQFGDPVSCKISRISAPEPAQPAQNSPSSESETMGNSTEINPSSDKKRSSTRRRRRPRKLPQLPIGAASKKFPTSVSLKAVINVRSLAEELRLADPTLDSPDPCSERSRPSFSQLGAKCPRPWHLNLADLGSPEQIDPEHKLHIEELDREKYLRITPYTNVEFMDSAEYIDDEELSSNQGKDKYISDDIPKSSHTSDRGSDTLLSSCDDQWGQESRPDVRHPESSSKPLGVGNSSDINRFKSTTGGLRRPEATHRGCHKFIPRHADEIFIEIGDPLCVEVEAEDLWCTATNLRTGQRGIFPSAYATDLSLLEDTEIANKNSKFRNRFLNYLCNDTKPLYIASDGTRPDKFHLQFMGSVEVNYHKGNDVLCQAIHKVAVNRRMTLNVTPPSMCCLEITEYGINMVDTTKKTEDCNSPPYKSKIISMLAKGNKKDINHFFPLKNVSFCGCHPRNEKYFAFITKHPLDQRFACHVFLGEESTKCIAEAIGSAFKRFYQEYMAMMHPTEDIYIE